MKNMIIFGASRGIGAALACGVPDAGDQLWLVSRGRPTPLERADGVTRTWIRADLSQAGAAQPAAAELRGQRLDALIYNAGIWETDGFSDNYRFETVSPTETQAILTVNLQSAMFAVQALLPNLRQSDNAKVILIGSTSGLEHAATQEAAYAASKFGLRGLAHALRHTLRPERIGITCLNPGTVAAELDYDDGPVAALQAHAETAIPLHDLVAVVRCALSLSRAACLKEIDLPAMQDTNA